MVEPEGPRAGAAARTGRDRHRADRLNRTARTAFAGTRRAARLLTERQPVVVAPTVWNGLAEHHMALGGTITLDFQTFFALLRCICGSMVRHGFRRLLLLNGHGGNITALNVIVGELHPRI